MHYSLCAMWKVVQRAFSIHFQPIKLSQEGVNKYNTRTEISLWADVISKADNIPSVAWMFWLFFFFYAHEKRFLVFPIRHPACFKRRSLRYSCSVLPLQALCKYSCPPLPAGCWSILQAYIRSLLADSSVHKLNEVIRCTWSRSLLYLTEK